MTIASLETRISFIEESDDALAALKHLTSSRSRVAAQRKLVDRFRQSQVSSAIGKLTLNGT